MSESLRSYAAAVIVELVGIIVTFAGILVEVETEAEVGRVLITAGSLLVALGSFIWAKVLRKPAKA